MTIQSKEQAKAKAHALQNYLQAEGVTLKHRKALDAIARIEGLPNWNTLQAKLPDKAHADAGSLAQVVPSSAGASPVAPKAQGQWSASLVRIGYGFLQASIQAYSLEEALEKAEALGADTYISEDNYSWGITHLSRDAESIAVPNWAEMPPAVPVDYSDHKHVTGLALYEVNICREGIAHSDWTFNGEFSSIDDAAHAALESVEGDNAVDISESNSEYTIEILCVTPKPN